MMIAAHLSRLDRLHHVLLPLPILAAAITMVTLDQSLAVNYIAAHVGDNVEIRCDISGKPQTPSIQWFRYNVNLASLNIPHMKVSIIIFHGRAWPISLLDY